MIAILDYGLGNIRAFANVYQRLGFPYCVAREASALDSATHVILPGVGAFDEAVSRLNSSGLRSALDSLLAAQRVPILGICVGMQLLARGSEEGSAQGLGLIPGEVRKLDVSDLLHRAQLPHLGWNSVSPARESGLFRDLEPDAQFYFLHSYYYACDDAADVLAHADYGSAFACAVGRENVFGVQFHPEKSHDCGAQLLRNFVETTPCCARV